MTDKIIRNKTGNLEETMINDITIGPLTIHVYGIMVAIGYMSALLISEKRARKRGLDSDILFGIFWCAVLGGAVGSKLLYYTVSFKDILNDPSMLLNFQNGWVVYGGIIGYSGKIVYSLLNSRFLREFPPEYRLISVRNALLRQCQNVYRHEQMFVL